MEGLTDVQDRISDVTQQIEQLLTVQDIPVFDYDIDSIIDPMNVEIRSKVRKELRLVLSMITYRVIDKFILINLEYFSDVLKHVLIIDNKRGGGDILTQITIQNVNESTSYETPSFKIIVTNEILSLDSTGVISMNDYALLLNYIDSIDSTSQIASWMRENYNLFLSNLN